MTQTGLMSEISTSIFGINPPKTIRYDYVTISELNQTSKRKNAIINENINLTKFSFKTNANKLNNQLIVRSSITL